MSIALKIEQELFIQKKLKSGKYSSADEVIFEAFRLLEERDRHYEQWLQDTRQKVADGLAQLDRGEGLDGESVMARFKSQSGENVALIGSDELQSLLETMHLLRSPRNAERLLNAISRARTNLEASQTTEE